MDEVIPRAWKSIAQTGSILFGISLLAWSLFIFPYLHWGVGVFAAMLTTPIVAGLWYRVRAIRKLGFRFLPKNEALRLYGWSCLAFVSLYLFISSFEHLRGRMAFAALKRQLETKGQSLDLKSVIPPPIPDEENFCAIPLLQSQVEFSGKVTLFNRLKPLPSPHHERIQSLGIPSYQGEWVFARLANLEPVRDAMPTNRIDSAIGYETAAGTILRRYEGQRVLSELRDAMSRPQARWNLPYESGWFVCLATLARDNALYSLTQTLRLRALAALADGKPDLALDDVHICLRLSDSLKGEPSPYAFSVRHKLLRWSLAPIWEGLARRSWTPEQLTQLQDRLGEFDLIESGREQDQITAIVWTSMWQDADGILSPGNLFTHWSQFQNDPGEAIGTTIIWSARPSGWSYLNMVNTYRWLEPDSDAKSQKIPFDPAAAIFFTPKFKSFVDYRMEYRPRLHLAFMQARIACALERYWLKHQIYPENLEEMVSEWIDDLPPLSYRRTPNHRYLLHSSMRENVPDEYLPSQHHTERHDTELGDGVWRYPKNME